MFRVKRMGSIAAPINWSDPEASRFYGPNVKRTPAPAFIPERQPTPKRADGASPSKHNASMHLGMPINGSLADQQVTTTGRIGDVMRADGSRRSGDK